MKSTIVRAPAKVNLYLDVINRRPDGYHNIETIFERIDLCDWIKVSIIPKGIKLICQQNLFIDDVDNTAYKAAKLLKERCNLRCGFRIEIDKRIPIAAGLGGGSSDAAAALLAINNLIGIRLKKEVLLKLATDIGADVPFFVSEYKRAFATGIGERLSPLNQRHKLYFILVVPDKIRIPTSNVYNRLNLNLTNKKRNANMFSQPLQYSGIDNVRDILFNKLEEVVLPSYPVLGNIKKALKKTGAEGILVSGSGSAVYGLYTSRKEAIRAENKLRESRNCQLFLTSNC